MEFREAKEAKIYGAEYGNGINHTVEKKKKLFERSPSMSLSLIRGGGRNYIVHSYDQLSKVRERATIRGFVRLTISRDHIVPTTQVERTH